MRGKREKYQIFRQVGRITPAGAGKTDVMSDFECAD